MVCHKGPINSLFGVIFLMTLKKITEFSIFKNKLKIFAKEMTRIHEIVFKTNCEIAEHNDYAIKQMNFVILKG